MNKRIVIVSALLLFVTAVALAQKPVVVMFYNVENFFDTINDPDVNDEEFTPEGSNNWTGDKYYKKLANVEKVLFDIAKNNKTFPAVIGLSEVEVRSVLEDIASTPSLKAANYHIAHFDSRERRGVDVAFLYRPDVFKIEGAYPHRATMPGYDDYKTRDILGMWGTIEGEPFYFMVMHWSSRWGGKENSSYRREAAAAQVRQIADSVLAENPATKVVIMGDMNDDPADKSIYEILGAKGKLKEVPENGYFNPYWAMHRAGYGSLGYQDQWNIFDNIIVSKNLVEANEGTLTLQKSPSDKRFYGNIFKAPYMIQKSGKYKGYPLRSFSGGAFIGGFSDHLPVYIIID